MLAAQQHNVGRETKNVSQIYRRIHGIPVGCWPNNNRAVPRAPYENPKAKSVLNEWLKLNELGRLKRIRSRSVSISNETGAHTHTLTHIVWDTRQLYAEQKTTQIRSKSVAEHIRMHTWITRKRESAAAVTDAAAAAAAAVTVTTAVATVKIYVFTWAHQQYDAVWAARKSVCGVAGSMRIAEKQEKKKEFRLAR